MNHIKNPDGKGNEIMNNMNDDDEFYNRYIDYLERREFAKPLRTLPVTAKNIPEYKMLFNELDWILSCLEHLQELDAALPEQISYDGISGQPIQGDNSGQYI